MISVYPKTKAVHLMVRHPDTLPSLSYHSLRLGRQPQKFQGSAVPSSPLSPCPAPLLSRRIG